MNEMKLVEILYRLWPAPLRVQGKEHLRSENNTEYTLCLLCAPHESQYSGAAAVNTAAIIISL